MNKKRTLRNKLTSYFFYLVIFVMMFSFNSSNVSAFCFLGFLGDCEEENEERYDDALRDADDDAKQDSTNANAALGVVIDAGGQPGEKAYDDALDVFEDAKATRTATSDAVKANKDDPESCGIFDSWNGCIDPEEEEPGSSPDNAVEDQYTWELSEDEISGCGNQDSSSCRITDEGDLVHKGEDGTWIVIEKCVGDGCRKEIEEEEEDEEEPTTPSAQCTTLQAGCYDNQLNKVKSGNIGIDDFNFFINNKVCVDNEAQITKKQKADSSQVACSCVSGTDWFAGKGCCGDTKNDCGTQVDGVICSLDSNYINSNWLPSLDNAGEIITLGCNNVDYVSDGNEWVECSDLNINTIAGHDFLCSGTATVLSETVSTEEEQPTERDDIDNEETEEERAQCENSEGKWREFGNTCGDVCGTVTTCGQALTYGCDCGSELCWDGNSCIVDNSDYDSIDPLRGIFIASQKTRQIVECCGEGLCKSDEEGGIRLDPGESVSVGNEVYYCTKTAELKTDLDTLDSEICETAKNPDGTDAGFVWTGHLCCSEADDPNEYYNDVDGNKGCWNSEVISHGQFVEEDRVDLISLDGIFYGCGIDRDDDVLDIPDAHADQPVVVNENYCFQDSQSIYFCDISNSWQPANGEVFSHLSITPAAFDGPITSGCCPEDQCWNGNSCSENQAENPSSTPLNGYRCVNGDWTIQTEKTALNGEPGYCPDDNQCLVNSNGNFADNDNTDRNPQCISHEQYINDDYCESGDWTSRTKFIALQLQEMAAGNNYIIFCDDAVNVLNNLNYIVGSELAENLVAGPNINNFCVLVNDKVIFATSLNQPLTEDNSFLDVVGVENCNVINKDKNQHLCWYDEDKQTIFYSNEAFSIGQQTKTDFVRTTFKRIVGFFTNRETTTDTDFLEDLGKYDRLYLSDQDRKTIFGTIKGGTDLVIEYTNFFDTDICGFVNDYNTKNTDERSNIECIEQDNKDYVVAHGFPQTTLIDPEQLWFDLTSKLRV